MDMHQLVAPDQGHSVLVEGSPRVEETIRVTDGVGFQTQKVLYLKKGLEATKCPRLVSKDMKERYADKKK